MGRARDCALRARRVKYTLVGSELGASRIDHAGGSLTAQGRALSGPQMRTPSRA